MAENKRHRQRAKRGSKRFVNTEVYNTRFVSERSFAWFDTIAPNTSPYRLIRSIIAATTRNFVSGCGICVLYPSDFS
jgi:hypothetical protein